MKYKLFQAVAVSVLLYSCTTRILMKSLEKKGRWEQQMLFWINHAISIQQNSSCTATCQPSHKPFNSVRTMDAVIQYNKWKYLELYHKLNNTSQIWYRFVAHWRKKKNLAGTPYQIGWVIVEIKLIHSCWLNTWLWQRGYKCIQKGREVSASHDYQKSRYVLRKGEREREITHTHTHNQLSVNGILYRLKPF